MVLSVVASTTPNMLLVCHITGTTWKKIIGVLAYCRRTFCSPVFPPAWHLSYKGQLYMCCLFSHSWK